MAFTYSNLKSDLETQLGNHFSSLVNPRRAINNAVRELALEMDLRTTIRHSQGVQVAYDDVYRYSTPSDIKGENLIDMVKAKDKKRLSNVEYEKVPLEQFNRYFTTNTYTYDHNNGVNWFKINHDVDSSKILVSELDSLTANGTWTATDSGTNLQTNTFNYITGSASLSLDMTALGTTMSITNSTLTAVDLSTLEDKGKLFLWVYLPEVSTLTSVDMRWGSDASNYWSNSATAPFYGGTFEIGWNLVAFGWDGATETATPDASAIDYVKIDMVFSTSPTDLTGYLFDSLIAGLGEAIEYVYYSQYMWRTSSANWIEDSTLDTDILNVEGEEYMLVVYKTAITAGRSIPISGERMQQLQQAYYSAKAEYETKYPSQRKRMMGLYYNMN